MAVDPPPDVLDRLRRVYRAETVDAHGVKAACVETLGALTTPGAAGLLGEMLADRDYWVRKGAARVLGQVPGPMAFEALIRAAGDEDPRVRAQALEALGVRGEGAAVIRTALDDPDDRVVAAALGALDAVGAEQALGRLVAALGADSWRVQLRAAGCLARRGDPRGVEALSGTVRRGEHLSTALREWSALGGRAVAPLAGLYGEVGLAGPTRTRIVEALTGIETREATEFLLDLVDRATASPVDRVAAALAVHDRRERLDRGQVDRVAGWVDAADPNLVGVALQILLDVGEGTALERIAPLTADDNPVIRHFALSNLARYGDRRYEPQFLRALADPKGANVRLALGALEQHGTPEALAALKAIAEVRKYHRYAQAAIEAIEGRR